MFSSIFHAGRPRSYFRVSKHQFRWIGDRQSLARVRNTFEKVKRIPGHFLSSIDFRCCKETQEQIDLPQQKKLPLDLKGNRKENELRDDESRFLAKKEGLVIFSRLQINEHRSDMRGEGSIFGRASFFPFQWLLVRIWHLGTLAFQYFSTLRHIQRFFV